MTLKKIPLAILAIFLSLLSCKVGKQNTVNTVPHEIEVSQFGTVTDITEDDIRLHIGILASDSMRGRKSASTDEAIAAEYIKEKFISLGLKAFNDNYLQQVPITTRKTFGNCELFFDGYAGEYPKDFRSMIMFDSITVAGEVIFAGYGNDSDFNNLNANGKWIMILEGSNSILYDKKTTVKKLGASGLLVIGMDGTTGADRYVLASDSIPMIKISQRLADQLFAQANLNAQEVLNKTKSGENQNVIIPLTLTATIKSASDVVTSRNVIAYLESNNPEYKNNYIVIGAHFDHVGTQIDNDSLQIFNGADDNASGVAGVLEIAEKLCAEKNLKYNIIFTTFGAEEMGLWGSRYFCNNPPVPLEQIKFMFNMDMIGRMDLEKRVYFNTGKPDEKLNIAVDVIKESHPGINPVPSFESYETGSDHTSFYNKKIPVMFFLTGLHNDYHKPTDTIEKINYKGEKLILDFIYDLVISPEIDDFIRSFTSSGVNP